MKSLLLVCVVLAIVEIVYGALYIIPADPTPGHPGHCNSDITGPLNDKESKYLKDCSKATCYSDGSIQVATCGAIGAPCGVTGLDLTKNYPDCCPQPKSC